MQTEEKKVETMNKILKMVLVLLILCGCALTSRDLPKLYKINVPAVVSIHVDFVNLYTGKRKMDWNGSGFIIDKNKGWIVTAGHVVRNFRSFLVELNTGTKIAADLYLVDLGNDIAVLKVDPKLLEARNMPTFQLELAPAIGEQVFSIGRPNGFTNTISFGILSRGLTYGIEMSITLFCGAYLADFRVFGGSSGCPVFNLENKIVGMVVGTSGNFVIIVPANSIDKVLKKCKLKK